MREDENRGCSLPHLQKDKKKKSKWEAIPDFLIYEKREKRKIKKDKHPVDFHIHREKKEKSIAIPYTSPFTERERKKEKKGESSPVDLRFWDKASVGRRRRKRDEMERRKKNPDPTRGKLCGTLLFLLFVACVRAGSEIFDEAVIDGND